MMIWHTTLIRASICIFIVSSWCNASDSLIRELRENGTASWSRLKVAYHNAGVDFTQSMLEMKNGEYTEIQTKTQTYDFSKGCVRAHFSNNGNESVFIRNRGHYSFFANADEANDFSVTDLNQGDESQDIAELPQQLSAAFSVLYTPLEELLKEDGFDINMAETVSDKPRIVRFEFSSPKNERFLSGVVDMLPDDLWAVKSYRLTMAETPDSRAISSHRSRTITYGKRIGDFLPVVEIVEEFRTVEAPLSEPVAKEITRFTRFAQVDHPLSYFTFSAVGLPELESKRTIAGLWWLVLVIGIVLFVLSFKIRKPREWQSRRAHHPDRTLENV